MLLPFGRHGFARASMRHSLIQAVQVDHHVVRTTARACFTHLNPVSWDRLVLRALPFVIDILRAEMTFVFA